MGLLRIITFSLAALLFLSASMADADPLKSIDMVQAKVINVIDGDTITVEAYPWLGMTITTSVRLQGVDTPELKGKCPSERAMALQAKEFVEAHIGKTVVLKDVTNGKFAGRVVATVDDRAEQLIKAGLGRPYDGGKRESWC